ncbi:DUF2520 domain-containing protein [Planctomycetota bacterium]|nr:DUF2520 domain-containing protein [Planctomycetota bacterium]
MNQPSLAVYGAGRFGRAFAVSAHSAGLEISALGNRSDVESPVAGIPLQCGVLAFLAHLTEPTIVILAVSDDAIADVAAEFGRHQTVDHWYVHTAGSRGSNALEPLKNRGCFHILQSFPALQSAAKVADSFCAITATEPLSSWLHEIAKTIGARPLDLAEDGRLAYHTAAVVASNALVGLADFGREILEQAGIEEAAEMLLPLMQGTLGNLRDAHGDTQASLTGPIARGDVLTIEKHLAALTPQQRKRYANLVSPLLKLSSADPESLNKIKTLLTET